MNIMNYEAQAQKIFDNYMDAVSRYLDNTSNHGDEIFMSMMEDGIEEDYFKYRAHAFDVYQHEGAWWRHGDPVIQKNITAYLLGVPKPTHRSIDDPWCGQ